MSWQTYVDSSLMQSKAVAAASIHGLDGTAWARSPGFSVSTTCTALLAQCLGLRGDHGGNDPDRRSLLFLKGVGSIASASMPHIHVRRFKGFRSTWFTVQRISRHQSRNEPTPRRVFKKTVVCMNCVCFHTISTASCTGRY